MEEIKKLEKELNKTFTRIEVKKKNEIGFTYSIYENEFQVYKNKIVSLSFNGYIDYLKKLVLPKIPESLKYFRDLQFLSMTKFANLENFESLKYLKNLNSLTLDNLDLKEIPIELNELKKLNLLMLKDSSNKIDLSNLKYLKNLEVLYLDGYEIKTLPNELKYNQKLKALSLYFIRNLKNLDVLKHLKNTLIDIEIRSENLTKVPSIVSELKALEKFTMKETRKGITDISSLKNLPKLKELSLGSLYVKKLPETINTLKNLEKIFIWKSLPPNADLLKGLKKIKSIESVSSLKNAKTFSALENLQIESHKKVDLSAISNLTNLKELILFTKNLKILHESLFTNKNLSCLVIYSDELEEIPESISKLKNLKKIIFRDGCKKLQSISALNSVNSLKYISLYEVKNQLKEILVSQISTREGLEISV